MELEELQRAIEAILFAAGERVEVSRLAAVLETDEADIIFMDPPYDRGLEKSVLEKLAGSALVTEDTWIVVEASLQTDFSYLDALGMEIFREKKYKNNQHVFIQLQVNEPA
jgi:16S rRNA G966 N2-methylase RsmD